MKYSIYKLNNKYGYQITDLNNKVVFTCGAFFSSELNASYQAKIELNKQLNK